MVGRTKRTSSSRDRSSYHENLQQHYGKRKEMRDRGKAAASHLPFPGKLDESGVNEETSSHFFGALPTTFKDVDTLTHQEDVDNSDEKDSAHHVVQQGIDVHSDRSGALPRLPNKEKEHTKDLTSSVGSSTQVDTTIIEMERDPVIETDTSSDDDKKMNKAKKQKCHNFNDLDSSIVVDLPVSLTRQENDGACASPYRPETDKKLQDATYSVEEMQTTIKDDKQGPSVTSKMMSLNKQYDLAESVLTPSIENSTSSRVATTAVNEISTNPSSERVEKVSLKMLPKPVSSKKAINNAADATGMFVQEAEQRVSESPDSALELSIKHRPKINDASVVRLASERLSSSDNGVSSNTVTEFSISNEIEFNPNESFQSESKAGVQLTQPPKTSLEHVEYSSSHDFSIGLALEKNVSSFLQGDNVHLRNSPPVLPKKKLEIPSLLSSPPNVTQKELESIDPSQVLIQDAKVPQSIKPLAHNHCERGKDLDSEEKTSSFIEEITVKLKEEGNKHLQQGDAQKAIDSYTHGLKHDPTNFVLYSNRSAAYAKLKDYEKALEDAESCIKANPTFLKGHSRRAAALLSLGRPLEALQAASLGLLIQTTNKGSIEILEDTYKRAQRQLLGRAIKGRWKGKTDTSIGGYEQIFDFGSEANDMIITVMERPTNARWLLRDGKPLAMDVTAIADVPQPFMEPPTVPYIYRMFYRDPNTGERKEYNGTTELPTYPEVQTGSTGEAVEFTEEACNEWNEKMQWEMEMCAPFLSMDRPDKFEGPGVILMKKCYKPDPPRRIAPEIEGLCFDDQLSTYFSELLTLRPDMPLEEPSPTDDQISCASKIALFMKCQSEVHSISRRFPDSVSITAEQLFATTEQLEVSARGSLTEILERREQQIQSLSQSCRELLHEVREHIHSSGLHLLQFGTYTSTELSDLSSFAPPAEQISTMGKLNSRSGTEHYPATDSSSLRRDQTAPKKPLDEAAKHLLDELSEEQPSKSCTTWCKENQSMLITSAIIVASLGIITYLCMNKKRT